MYRIFIIEDDSMIAATLGDSLSKWGFEVTCANEFQDIMPQFTAFSPQLVLLDISLPFYNGYHWCREIRKRSKVPVVFLSSASDQMNIVMAMNMGGDDFIAKPFDRNVLVAKIQALLRRTYEFELAAELIEHRGAILHLHDGTLHYENLRIELTKNEFRILKTLMERRNSVVSREEIMQRLWENDSYVDDNTLTVNVARLRKKLEEAGLHDYIHTKKGMGYLVESP